MHEDPDYQKSKGFGFCEYRDVNVACNAVRNLNKYEMSGRSLKVHFASDNKNGVNLRQEEMKERDAGEIKVETEASLNLHEVLRKHLSIDQKEMLMKYLKKISENEEDRAKMIELLDKDESLC